MGEIMAIEPKVVYKEGSIGIEDTWIRNTEGLECITNLNPCDWIMEV